MRPAMKVPARDVVALIAVAAVCGCGQAVGRTAVTDQPAKPSAEVVAKIMADWEKMKQSLR